MNEMTSRVIATGQKGQNDYCFFVKHSPGTRKMDLISHSLSLQVRDMRFISDDHVLLQFKKNFALTMSSNGIVTDQPDPKIMKVLSDPEISIVNEST